MRNSLFLQRTFVHVMGTRQLYNRLIFCLLFIFSLNFLSAAEDFEAITTIILINGNAELVDVNIQGEVLKRHISIPDYFTSGRSHEGSMGKGMKMIDQYGSVDESFLPGSSNLPSKCLQSFMMSISQDLKQEKICSSLDTFFTTNDRPKESLTHSMMLENNAKTSNSKALIMRKDRTPIYLKNLESSALYSSESLKSYVYIKLNFYSAKSKEPLRHRIV